MKQFLLGLLLAFVINSAFAQKGNIGATISKEKLRVVDSTVLSSGAHGSINIRRSTVSNSAFRASFSFLDVMHDSTVVIPFSTYGNDNFDDCRNWSNTKNRLTATEPCIYHFDAIVSFGDYRETASKSSTINL